MDLDYFREIVSGGALTSNGMPQFKDLSSKIFMSIFGNKQKVLNQ
jgi:hypothetical protein